MNLTAGIFRTKIADVRFLILVLCAISPAFLFASGFDVSNRTGRGRAVSKGKTRSAIEGAEARRRDTTEGVLTGVFRDQTGTIYRIRHLGERVDGIATSSPADVSVFRGRVHGKKLRVDWIELTGTRAAPSGSIFVEIISPDRLVWLEPETTLPSRLLTRIESGPAASSATPAPPKKPAPFVRATDPRPKAGEPIEIEWCSIAGTSNDWLTVVPLHSSSGRYDEWHMLPERHGRMRFKPLPAGSYEVRLFLDWPRGGYEVAARFPIEVEAAIGVPLAVAAPAPATPRISLDKTFAAHGESVEADFESPADREVMIGLVPASTPHGEMVPGLFEPIVRNVAGGIHGSFSFVVPGGPGDGWDVRMYTKGEKSLEVATATILIGQTGARVWIEGATNEFRPGEEIRVGFEAPASFDKSAWVGLVPSQIPHGDENRNDQHDVAYEYLAKRTKGSLRFRAPAILGSWDARMNSSDSGGKERASVTFQVVAPK